MKASIGKVCYSAVICLGLASCSPPPRVEVIERPTISARAEAEKIGGSLVRIVVPGDTLYGIAFGNGLNVNDLAAWNGISDTTRLQAGRKIRLTKPLNFKPKPKIAKRKPVVVESVESTVRKPSIQTAKSRVKKQASKKTLAANRKAQAAKNTSVKARPTWSASNASWVWPANGPVIDRFIIAKGQQGIAIQSSLGQDVMAAKGGEVVYVGNGLKGYGNLVIIKHNEHFLSAYAHNQQTYVKEGQKVASKHIIGAVGTDNKRRQALHFQIRKDGKPVNPLSYLPAR